MRPVRLHSAKSPEPLSAVHENTLAAHNAALHFAVRVSPTSGHQEHAYSAIWLRLAASPPAHFAECELLHITLRLAAWRALPPVSTLALSSFTFTIGRNASVTGQLQRLVRRCLRSLPFPPRSQSLWTRHEPASRLNGGGPSSSMPPWRLADSPTREKSDGFSASLSELAGSLAPR